MLEAGSVRGQWEVRRQPSFFGQKRPGSFDREPYDVDAVMSSFGVSVVSVCASSRWYLGCADLGVVRCLASASLESVPFSSKSDVWW